MKVFEGVCQCDFPREKAAKDQATSLGHDITAFVHPELDGKDLTAPLIEGYACTLARMMSVTMSHCLLVLAIESQ